MIVAREQDALRRKSALHESLRIGHLGREWRLAQDMDPALHGLVRDDEVIGRGCRDVDEVEVDAGSEQGLNGFVGRGGRKDFRHDGSPGVALVHDGDDLDVSALQIRRCMAPGSGEPVPHERALHRTRVGSGPIHGHSLASPVSCDGFGLPP